MTAHGLCIVSLCAHMHHSVGGMTSATVWCQIQCYLTLSKPQTSVD